MSDEDAGARPPRTLDVRAPPGRVRLELPETPGSGYVWRLRAAPAEVAVERHEFVAEAEQPQAGGGGVRPFEIEAPPGQHVLEFELKRGWEGAPLEHCLVTLHIE
jgi:predicted secreted protein